MSLLDDEKYMRLCFDLARQAEGRTAPNPMVGAVVVGEDGEIVGRGFHPQAGKPHAEVFALDQAGERARGATLYVSLEPCCHHGKTPPCTDKVIASGVRKVVAAMRDPNPKVAGGGFARLQECGIEIVYDVLADQAGWLNRAFIKCITRGMPWVCLKIAATLDGKIADRNGKSQWITGDLSRQYVHHLRNRFDCVLIGAGTARADDPKLNVRLDALSNGSPDAPNPDALLRSPEPIRHPRRAVIDGKLSLAANSHLCDATTGGETIVYCSEEAFRAEGHKYPAGVVLVPLNGGDLRHEMQKVDLSAVLKDLKSRSVMSILCEGGSRLAGELIAKDLVDEIIWMVAPAILGDCQGLSAVDSGMILSMSDASRFIPIDCKRLGDDTVMHLKARGDIA